MDENTVEKILENYLKDNLRIDFVANTERCGTWGEYQYHHIKIEVKLGERVITRDSVRF